MKITIVYDNTSLHPDLKIDWGFACFIEHENHSILFDTGTKGWILLDNMNKLGINPNTADVIFISHSHSDHMGGLPAVLKENFKAKIYLPITTNEVLNDSRFFKFDEPTNITKDIITSGLLGCEEQRRLVEQSLFLRSNKGLVVLAGCSHPGVGKILERSSEFGKTYALIGGFHGFQDFKLLEEIEIVCPTHCTRHIDKIRSLYPKKYIKGGVGAVINL